MTDVARPPKTGATRPKSDKSARPPSQTDERPKSEGLARSRSGRKERLGLSPKTAAGSPAGSRPGSASNKVQPTDTAVGAAESGAVQAWAARQAGAAPPDAETAVQMRARDLRLHTVGEGAEAEPAFDVVFRRDVPQHLQCRVCEQVLKSPKKLPCAHLFCSNCVAGKRECPTCGRGFDPSTIREDRATAKEVQQLPVKCSYYDNGCAWTGVLKQLKAHAVGCEFADTPCPRGCGEVFPLKDEEAHLAVCTKKLIPCQFCGKEVSRRGQKVHNKVCPMMIIDCPNRCGIEKRTREEMNKHLPDCPKKGSVCPFAEFGCDYRGGRENLQKHIKEDPVKHLSFLCDGVIELESLLVHVYENMERTNKNVGILQTRVDALEKLYGSQFIWRIDEYKQRFKEAKTGTRPILYSPPFLSGRHGYKLILSAALFGDGAAHGKALSIYLSILRGANDALLPWPFVHKVTFTLMDQNPDVNEREHMVYVIKPTPSEDDDQYLSRPKTERNAAFGAQKFCPLEEMEKYVREDALFIRCCIDTENMIVL